MSNQEKNCYLGINGKKYGPVSEADVQKLYDHNKITGDTKFARVGDNGWITVSEAGVFTPPLPTDDGLPPLPPDDEPTKANEPITNKSSINQINTNDTKIGTPTNVPAKKSKLGFVAAGLGVAVVAVVVFVVVLIGNMGNAPSVPADTNIAQGNPSLPAQTNPSLPTPASDENNAPLSDTTSDDESVVTLDSEYTAELLELQGAMLGQWHVYDAGLGLGDELFVGGELITFFADGTGQESAGGILPFTWRLEEAPEYASNRLIWEDSWRQFSVFPFVEDDMLFLHFEAGPPLILSRGARVDEPLDMVNRALGYLGANNYDQAAHYFRQAAGLGDATAQFHMGWFYEHGRAVKYQNYAEAASWYRMSAPQGNVFAQNNLGLLYQFGRGVNQDHDEAAFWFGQAAAQGYERAQSNLDALQSPQANNQVNVGNWPPPTDSMVGLWTRDGRTYVYEFRENGVSVTPVANVVIHGRWELDGNILTVDDSITTTTYRVDGNEFVRETFTLNDTNRFRNFDVGAVYVRFCAIGRWESNDGGRYTGSLEIRGDGGATMTSYDNGRVVSVNEGRVGIYERTITFQSDTGVTTTFHVVSGRQLNPSMQGMPMFVRARN